MKSGICLFWIAVGAILTFAVNANTSVFNLHVAGFVIMVIGIIGLVTPKRTYERLGRRVYVKRTRQTPGARVEETSYPPYVLRNPGTANARADIPDRPSLEPDPEVARWQEPAQTPEEEMATQRATIHGADRIDDAPVAQKARDTEVVEDVYEEE
ncbi:MAG TPA: hypothetical protein VGN41_02120 [Streptosporangiaceae bacterium]|jgi:hypothetical protein